MKVAHLSDPHLLDLEGVGLGRLLATKRLTGCLTIKLHRGSAHRGHVVEEMVRDINRAGVDHVVITGDITNLALESEFALARRVFDKLDLGPAGVSVIPGNHDVYTRGSERSQRFMQFFGAHATTDMPLAESNDPHPSGAFPFVRLRGPLAIIGLSTAIARPPFVAAGHAGNTQIAQLEALLKKPEVRTRTPVLLFHHPLVNPRGMVLTPALGMFEGQKILRVLHRSMDTGLVLHGHMHEREHRQIGTESGGTLHHIGATSASLVHRQSDRMAGYNIYDFGSDGAFNGAHARVWNESASSFVAGSIARGARKEVATRNRRPVRAEQTA